MCSVAVSSDASDVRRPGGMVMVRSESENMTR